MRMSSRLAALAVAVLGCSDSSPPRTSLEPTSPAGAPRPPPASPDEERYAGTYVYAGGEAERAAIQTAVDDATAGMVGVHIARGELMKRSEVRPTYTIRFDGKGTVSVETPGYPPETSPLTGAEVPLKTKYGDDVRESQRFVNGALVQHGRTSDGSGSTTFELLPDGNRLRVTRVSQSPKLPRPVEFRLTYVRRPGTP